MPLPFEWGKNLRHEVPAAPFINPEAALTSPAQQIPVHPALPPLDPWKPLELARKSLGCSRGAQAPHSPCSKRPGSLNHPQAIESHTSEDEKVQAIPEPNGWITQGEDGSMKHHNARIQHQQNSIEASQHKNPHCTSDSQPSQLRAAKNYRIYHSLFPSYPKSNLGVFVLFQTHINCCGGTKYYLE